MLSENKMFKAIYQSLFLLSVSDHCKKTFSHLKNVCLANSFRRQKQYLPLGWLIGQLSQDDICFRANGRCGAVFLESITKDWGHLTSANECILVPQNPGIHCSLQPWHLEWKRNQGKLQCLQGAESQCIPLSLTQEPQIFCQHL